MHTLAPPPLGRGEIHLWTTRLELDALARAGGLRLLSPGEAGRARRFVVRRRRLQYAAGRAWLRRLLQAYTAIPAAELEFRHGRHGKPELRQAGNGPAVRFNYSDSGDRALCAVALDADLGVDLETLPRRIDAGRLAKRVLTTGERRSLLALPPGRREAAFLALWTRKEAWGKALGVGIRYPLGRTELLDERPDGDPPLRLVSLALPFDGAGALAASLPDPVIRARLFHATPGTTYRP